VEKIGDWLGDWEVIFGLGLRRKVVEMIMEGFGLGSGVLGPGRSLGLCHVYRRHVFDLSKEDEKGILIDFLLVLLGATILRTSLPKNIE
jgi:hypothetical protein